MLLVGKLQAKHQKQSDVISHRLNIPNCFHTHISSAKELLDHDSALRLAEELGGEDSVGDQDSRRYVGRLEPEAAIGADGNLVLQRPAKSD